jgi:hypothetical protein
METGVMRRSITVLTFHRPEVLKSAGAELTLEIRRSTHRAVQSSGGQHCTFLPEQGKAITESSEMLLIGSL